MRKLLIRGLVLYLVPLLKKHGPRLIRQAFQKKGAAGAQVKTRPRR